MRRYRKWVLTLGLLAATPGVVTAAENPFKKLLPFGKKEATASQETTAGRSNQSVANDIADALRKANLKGADISIEFQKGVATLSGTATDFQQKSTATRVTEKVPGVNLVDNRLKVAESTGAVTNAGFELNGQTVPELKTVSAEYPSFGPANGARPMPHANQQKANEIAQAIQSANLQGADISIAFREGIVTLSGTVADDKQSVIAEQIARQVGDVRSVDNRLTVQSPFAEITQPPLPTNQQKANEIALAIQSANLQGADISIAFRDGVATLSGTVADQRQHAAAEQITRQVAGVGSVENQLAIGSPFEVAAQPAPATFENMSFQPRAPRSAPPSFESAQYPPQSSQSRDWAAYNQKKAEEVASALKQSKFKGYDIEIRYENGTVLLTGSVTDESQSSKALGVAKQVPGVLQVDNRLAVLDSQTVALPTTAPNQPVLPTNYYQPNGQPPVPPNGAESAPPPGGMPPANGAPMGAGPGYGAHGHAGGPYAYPAAPTSSVYNSPYMPQYAWPSYAAYPNSAQINYPTQYSASAWPYIGPFYPYPQVPLGWRQAQLEWDDGYWNLNFRPRTDRWWWFFNPKNW